MYDLHTFNEKGLFMKTEHVRIADLKAGELVLDCGGVFRVLEDARESQGHRPTIWHARTGHASIPGPSNCAVAASECVAGEVPGYFKPGSPWTLQGATFVKIRKIIN